MFKMNQKLQLLFLAVVMCNGIDTNSLRLKQVLILSRHNIRSPLASRLPQFSSKKWPKFNEQAGYLTEKGAIVEKNLGEYFSEWFKNENFLSEDCPSEDAVYVYANSVNRTIETAKVFVEAALKNCNITVHHKTTTSEEVMDSNFDPIIRNTTKAYKYMILNEINRKLRNNSKLDAALTELNKILEIKQADICKMESICDLTDISKNNISFEVGRQLWVNGPLFIANNVVDSFLMSYYEGLPFENIAWGLVKTPEEWEILTEIGRQDHNIRYRTVAEDIGAPLLRYLILTFLNYNKMPKLMLIVGHDFNQNAIFNSMGFKSLRLPNHYEAYPIGGKIVFQRWTDNKNDYLKIEYVYPTWAQARNGTKFSAKDPPQIVLLELKWCSLDRNGFCSWKEFINKLKLL